MARLLYRLGKWSFRAKWLVVAVWVVVVTAFGVGAATLQAGFADNFKISGTPSQEATEIYTRVFPEARNPLQGTGINIVFQAPEGQKLTDPALSSAIDTVIDDIRTNVEGVTDTERFGNPVTLNPEFQHRIIDTMVSQGLPEEMARADADNLSLLSSDETIGYTTFSLDVPTSTDVTQAQRDAITHALNVGRDAGLTVEAGGAAFGDPIEVSPVSETVGIAMAAVILIFTFGSLMAAGLPLINAVVGVSLGSMGITMATGFFDLNNTTPALAIMIGLAVGIDYALLIMFRYRHERVRMSQEEAAGMAVGTAGSAVVFAGLTVIIALVALGVANITFLTYMGFAAAFTVLVAVLVALTLLPALLGILGDRAFQGRFRRRGKRSDALADAPSGRHSARRGGRRRQAVLTEPKLTLGRRWARFVHRHPAAVIAVCVFGLGALTLPAMQLHLSLPSDTQSNLDTTQRKSADLLSEGFGPGINAPMLAVVDASQVNEQAPALEPLIRAQEGGPDFDRKKAAANAAFQQIVQSYSTTPDVKHVQIVNLSADGMGAQMLITPASTPEDEATNQLISALRVKERSIEESTGVETGITGLVPIQQDITNRLSGVMPLYLAIVVGLAILLLMVVFRSFWVPVVAGVGFLLSIGAAFGVTVLFWQEGLWGLVSTPGPIIAFMPIFLIGVCFGLAMDYQVFLVSAMREHYAATRGEPEPGLPYTATEASIIEGFTTNVRVVTAAALIMIAVFAAFIGQPLPFIKIFGFALGAGVLFDAFFIRMAFVPAAMFLMGHRTWFMPRFLNAILPRIDVEGTALEKDVMAREEHRKAAKKLEV